MPLASHHLLAYGQRRWWQGPPSGNIGIFGADQMPTRFDWSHHLPSSESLSKDRISRATTSNEGIKQPEGCSSVLGSFWGVGRAFCAGGIAVGSSFCDLGNDAFFTAITQSHPRPDFFARTETAGTITGFGIKHTDSGAGGFDGHGFPDCCG
tara:strand:- start:21292 stop:21747 length:456 start_codon:yes stop_codon:yes gene_type:complete